MSIFHWRCQSVDLGHRLVRCHTGVWTTSIALVKVLPCSSTIFGDLKPSCWAAATGHELPSVENLLDGQILTCNPMQGRPPVRVEAMICLHTPDHSAHCLSIFICRVPLSTPSHTNWYGWLYTWGSCSKFLCLSLHWKWLFSLNKHGPHKLLVSGLGKEPDVLTTFQAAPESV